VRIADEDTLQVRRVERRPINLEGYRRPQGGYRAASVDDVSTMITENTVIVEEGSERPSLVYVKIVPNPATRQAKQMLPLLAYGRTARTAGMKTESRIFGYAPRVAVRNDYCHATSLAVESPSVHAHICALGKGVDALYARFNPGLHEEHATQVAKVLPEWRIRDSVFTSGIINQNNILPYHHDAGNFTNVWSNMLVFKSRVEGGHLVVPEYDCAFEVADHTLLMFDGQRLLHGVTPMQKLSPKGFRYSIVYYALKEMWACLPPDEERARIQQTRQTRERRRQVKDAAQ
jgi:hypothetical protein